MYVCNNCDNVFDEDALSITTDYMGECFGNPSFKSYSVCPYCRSDDIQEAEKCELCEEWGHTDEYNGERYCEECVEYTKKKFGKFLIDNFNADERRLIYFCIDVDEWISQG